MLRKTPYLLVLAFGATVLNGCHLLPPLEQGQGMQRPDPPNVQVSSINLGQKPDRRSLASYYCYERLSGLQQLACRVLGPPPDVNTLQFQFDLELELTNNNPIPLPVVAALVAFTAYPDPEATATGSQQQNLGSVCLSMCEDPNNCAQSADACRSDEPEIRNGRDFAMAAAGFLISTALGERNFEDLRVRTVPAGEALRFIIRLSLDPRQMIALMREATLNLIQLLRDRQMPEFVIPFQIEGSIWVTVENFGRFGAGFGPYSDEWRLLDAVDEARN